MKQSLDLYRPRFEKQLNDQRLLKKVVMVISLFVLAMTHFGIISPVLAQDYTADNRLYKTIDWDVFLSKLDKNPNLIFFDIRTPGERYDTSKYVANNQGRIKGSIQTDYFDFKKYYPEYLKHKDDTIYLYCSHSMRSRRLAKQLADSSFTKIVNINGGMSYLNLCGEKRYPLKKKFYETGNRYKLVSPLDLKSYLTNNNVQIIDIRPDSVYRGIARSEADNRIGKLDGVIHIPGDKLIREELKKFSKSKPILLIDNWGDESPVLANRLIDLGFTDVRVLHFGLDDLIDRLPSSQRTFLKTKYPIILPEELLALKGKNQVHVIDIRTKTEFTSTDTVAWKNVGRLKDVVNIPLSEFTKEAFQAHHDKPIVIYDIMMHDEIYDAAIKLIDYGFKDFSLLAGGIYFVRWKIANEHKRELEKLIY
jgi:rhodanese-related sulfurtransferase